VTNIDITSIYDTSLFVCDTYFKSIRQIKTSKSSDVDALTKLTNDSTIFIRTMARV